MRAAAQRTDRSQRLSRAQLQPKGSRLRWSALQALDPEMACVARVLASEYGYRTPNESARRSLSRYTTRRRTTAVARNGSVRQRRRSHTLRLGNSMQRE